MDFRIWGVLSALFGGITAILAKKGVEGVPSNLALAIRAVVIVMFALAIAYYMGETEAIGRLETRTWMYLTLSGMATGMSWLCYFRALQLGPVSQVAPIDKLSFVIAMFLGIVVLGETPTSQLLLGCACIVVGILITLS